MENKKNGNQGKFSIQMLDEKLKVDVYGEWILLSVNGLHELVN